MQSRSRVRAQIKIVLLVTVILFVFVSMVMAQEVPAHVVISEVYPDAVNESDSEWIELYNPTEADINIGGWTIDTATHISDATLSAGATIPGHGFYLIADAGFSTGKDNPTWPAADLEDEIALRNGDGWCQNKLFQQHKRKEYDCEQHGMGYRSAYNRWFQ